MIRKKIINKRKVLLCNIEQTITECFKGVKYNEGKGFRKKCSHELLMCLI